jgi:secreted trypsin-like serine protease
MPTLGKVVASIDSCEGDSGGGWYHMNSSGRIAWGIQSQADDPDWGEVCHGAGEKSYFSSIPQINEYWDNSTTISIRLETR